MKKINIKTVAILAGAAFLAGCSENAWNDHLDGFKEPPVYSKVETVAYTLTAADYKSIASNSTNKSLAEEEGLTAELAAIGTNGYFENAEDARMFLPAYISSTSFPYYVLNDGSSVNISYNLITNQPENVLAVNKGVKTCKVTKEDYQTAWGSDEAYVEAFAPAAPADASIPSILKAKYPGAKSGDYAVVSYNEATSNPNFGGSVPDQPTGPVVYLDETFAQGQGEFTIENVVMNDPLTYVWAADTRGYMKGSAYKDNVNYYADSWLISPEMKLGKDANATLVFDQAWNFFGSLILAREEATVHVREVGGEWVKLSPLDFPANDGWTFVSSGEIDLSAYNGKTIQIGFHYLGNDVKCGTFEVKNVRVAENAATKATRADASVASVSKNALYTFDGSNWTVPGSMLILQPSDYTAMGQSYANLSGTSPETLLPIYLNQQLPYASDDVATVVVYNYYNGSSTAYKASQFTKTDGVWTINNGATVDKFTRKAGSWSFNPSVELTLPYSRNTDPSYAYYMACKEWVFDNVTLKLYPDATPANGSKPGPPFIDYRDNAEFYSGASAFYGNVDVRASTAVNNAPEGYTGYDGLSDDEITELIKKRFCTETFPGALGIIHADSEPVDGMEVTYTYHFTAYTSGGAIEYTMVYLIVGKGEFEFVSCDWWEDGKPVE